MSEPNVPAKAPAVQELEPGKYAWCSCGKSGKQTFCDGSHAGSEFSPVRFELTEKKKVAICQCKHTKNPPYCDGSHKNI